MNRTAYVNIYDVIIGNNPISDIYMIVAKKPNRKVYKLKNLNHDYTTGWLTHNQIKKGFVNLGHLGRLLYG